MMAHIVHVWENSENKDPTLKIMDQLSLFLNSENDPTSPDSSPINSPNTSPNPQRKMKTLSKRASNLLLGKTDSGMYKKYLVDDADLKDSLEYLFRKRMVSNDDEVKNLLSSQGSLIVPRGSFLWDFSLLLLDSVSPMSKVIRRSFNTSLTILLETLWYSLNLIHLSFFG